MKDKQKRVGLLPFFCGTKKREREDALRRQQASVHSARAAECIIVEGVPTRLGQTKKQGLQQRKIKFSCKQCQRSEREVAGRDTTGG